MTKTYKGIARDDYIKTKTNVFYKVVEVLPQYDGFYCASKDNYNYFIPASDIIGRVVRNKQMEV